MSEARERLKALKQKHKLFKQQQFIFIAALERSREHAHDKTEPVASVMQVQGYRDLHCSNSTDRGILSLFLGIVEELGAVLKLLEGSAHSPGGCGAMDTCRLLLSPKRNISKLLAHYPHDEVNRLSCDEARNYYGGVVSLIPLAQDLLHRAASSSSSSSYCPGREGLTPLGCPTANHLQSSTQPDRPLSGGGGGGGGGSGGGGGTRPARKTLVRRAGGGSKPAWRPPGRTRI